MAFPCFHGALGLGVGGTHSCSLLSPFPQVPSAGWTLRAPGGEDIEWALRVLSFRSILARVWGVMVLSSS